MTLLPELNNFKLQGSQWPEKLLKEKSVNFKSFNYSTQGKTHSLAKYRKNQQKNNPTLKNIKKQINKDINYDPEKTVRRRLSNNLSEIANFSGMFESLIDHCGGNPHFESSMHIRMLTAKTEGITELFRPFKGSAIDYIDLENL